MAENTEVLEQPADGSLTRAALAGGAWTLISNLTTKALGGVKTVILARLLAPADFGLMGLALAVISSVNFFSNPGSYAALIQKKDLDDRDLNAGWWIHLILCNFLFFLVFLLAPLLADFFREPRLAVVLRLASLTLILDGLQSIGLVRLNRSLEFRRLALLQLISNAAGLAVAILLAWRFRNVWALVGAHLAQATTMCIASHILEPFKPRAAVDVERARHLLRFGRYLLASAVAYFLINRGNEFLLGRFTGVEQYGYYALALTLMGMMSAPMEQLIGWVAFPVLSRIDGSDDRFASAFSRVFRTSVMLSAPLFGAMIVLGADFVPLALGRKWLPMTTPLVWLSVYGFFQSLTSTFQVAHSASGRVQRQALLRAIEFGFYITGAVPAALYRGPTGAACWLAVSGAFGFLLHIYGTVPYLSRIFRASGVALLGYLPLFALQAGMAAVMWNVPPRWPWISVGALLYTVVCATFVWRKESYLIVDLLGVAGMRRRKG